MYGRHENIDGCAERKPHTYNTSALLCLNLSRTKTKNGNAPADFVVVDITKILVVNETKTVTRVGRNL